MHIILFEPQIPQNTGNIVRTCAVTGCSLTLVEPLGFKIDDKKLKRAGLDYWENVTVNIAPNLEDLIEKYSPRIFFFSSKASRSMYDVDFKEGDALVFGAETHGLPKELLAKYPNQCITIPMKNGVRCLNLATAVGIGIYQAFRSFPHLLNSH